MASNLEINVFNYAKPLSNINVKNNQSAKTKTDKRPVSQTVILKGTKKPLSKLNIFNSQVLKFRSKQSVYPG